MIRLKTRGNAMVVVIFVATAVGITVMAGVGITGAISNSQSKQERAQEMKYVFAGASQLAVADLAAGKLLPGNSATYTIGNTTVTVATAPNPNLANSAILTISGSSLGNPVSSVTNVSYLPAIIDNTWSYGIFSSGAFTWPLGTSKVVGSVYFKNSISILGSGTVTKDFKTSSSLNPLSLLTIGGALLTGINVKTLPAISNSTYTSAATTVLSSSQTMNGYTMPSSYALVVINGNLTIHGTINGDGTIYVTGSVTVDGNLTRQNGGRHIMIVTPNNITFKATSGNSMTADGYYFAGGQISIQTALTNTGGLIANSFGVSSGFTITWDPWINQDSGNGQLMHAPGLWP
ncbi:MAG TPA: hypothetical protein VHE55_17430 [Fimbriimonadaceae bacterium]|nr:hypothetical protein [Fimbriimonadaceae bacterium]